MNDLKNYSLEDYLDEEFEDDSERFIASSVKKKEVLKEEDRSRKHGNKSKYSKIRSLKREFE